MCRRTLQGHRAIAPWIDLSPNAAWPRPGPCGRAGASLVKRYFIPETPTGIDTDSAGNIYVANGFGSTVVVFAPGANGAVSPLETFGGSNTGILGPQAVAVTPPYAIVTGQLPAGRVHHRYSARLRVAEGTSPYRWSLRLGHLPKGLHLSRSGVIYGQPAHAGRWVLTVAVRDSSRHRQTLRRRLAIVIKRH
jgi:hypothetical protein